uniref:Uncharacterized protein n=1 Tax=Candidatus Kentrum eta TaxID=2126337 RepID=A0A450U854_9GAMM|nr:MAG: hypothetical protein BECKH772A_GA0070896_100077 [Candidatus Kentron sp. H]VFJ90127.1 MAG: hypothetical protein BECKH772B_GA0070898_100087 [Candidatus Kentron sp. H]VFJ96489.1 MAG: hypothetical protein BECKH772C_GA0070978_100077 [Candidatus Kentron sp. H]
MKHPLFIEPRAIAHKTHPLIHHFAYYDREDLPKRWASLEVVLGYLMDGLLVAILARKIIGND